MRRTKILLIVAQQTVNGKVVMNKINHQQEVFLKLKKLPVYGFRFTIAFVERDNFPNFSVMCEIDVLKSKQRRSASISDDTLSTLLIRNTTNGPAHD